MGSNLVRPDRAFAASRTVVALDFPGYGECGPPTCDYTLGYCTDIPERVIDEQGLDDVVLVGNCIGAATALQFTARRCATVRGVVAINVLTAETAAPGLLGPLAALGVRSARARRAAPRRGDDRRARPNAALACQALRAGTARDDAQADPAVVEHLVQRWRQPSNAASLCRLRTDTFVVPRRGSDWPPVHLVWGQRNRILPARGVGAVNETIAADRCLILAQITDLYTADELKDRLVLAVVNLPPRQVADFVSEVLVLGVPTDGDRGVALVGPDREIPPGLRLL